MWHLFWSWIGWQASLKSTNASLFCILCCQRLSWAYATTIIFSARICGNSRCQQYLDGSTTLLWPWQSRWFLSRSWFSATSLCSFWKVFFPLNGRDISLFLWVPLRALYRSLGHFSHGHINTSPTFFVGYGEHSPPLNRKSIAFTHTTIRLFCSTSRLHLRKTNKTRPIVLPRFNTDSYMFQGTRCWCSTHWGWSSWCLVLCAAKAIASCRTYWDGTPSWADLKQWWRSCTPHPSWVLSCNFRLHWPWYRWDWAFISTLFTLWQWLWNIFSFTTWPNLNLRGCTNYTMRFNHGKVVACDPTYLVVACDPTYLFG